MKKILKRVLKQKPHGSTWGGMKYTYQQSLPYMTFWNFTMLTITAYNTTVKEWAYSLGFPIQIWHMALFVGCLMFGIMLFEHKYSIPSLYNYTWDQGMRHSTILPGRLDDIEKKVDQLDIKLDSLLYLEAIKKQSEDEDADIEQ